MIDIEDFKRFNDIYGHLAGDDVLREVGNCIGKELRDQDIVARYGGEEFIAFLPGTDKLEAAKMAERLCEKICSLLLNYNNINLDVTVSIGISDDNEDHCQIIDDIIASADNALYAAKRSGKNCVKVA